MEDYLFIVVSNRQPYIYKTLKGRVECLRGAGGVITALDPVMQACGGIWIANSTGDADKKACDSSGKVMVPPEGQNYALKFVSLTKEEENGYYYGYSNEAIWPLCHMAFQRPVFRQEDWEYYVRVNEKFAKAVIEEIGNKKAFVWIQDYHLALLAKYLKQMAPGQLIVAHFWHIPWPNYETFRICPQRREILEGLLSNDLLGFHICYHCDNFLDAIDREIESKIDRERFAVAHSEHETMIRPYPISVDFSGISDISQSDEVMAIREKLQEEYSLRGYRVLLGIDRIDYTKGIPERLRAVERLLEKHPELREKIVFLQMGQISRIHIPRYKQINDEINALVEEINWKYSTDSWKPIILVRRHLSFKEVLAFFSLGELCVVSSLHDGMNLVAKEFICSRVDMNGMLVLSQFTGAARELTDAVLINPYDREQFSEGIWQALNFNEEEKIRRMEKMRNIIQKNNIYRWSGKVLSELLKFEFSE
ncbi:MAG: trehalose-6-phosphate synthase [Candidatus Omnitrophica bacterium CG11_big_fil_rev_8_21_14_0_20_42_13]|uniref:Trehalose-6-phosphate synthase n=1 Tax=Candidatus Ghiorseimicrobium undicola TaxID=1974746 RepID=A0A2H0LZ39_9BACT|nr:MAG: trehalose-6-phosphate synthase [Candidatus Omnitrophica bacterium CG11_big_fil_rev_8_21_14_0_20_42_13]